MKKYLIILLLILPFTLKSQDLLRINQNGNIVKFQGNNLIKPYNDSAIAYFSREYELPPQNVRRIISNTFDILKPLYSKIKLLYVFAGYSDSSTMHSWFNNYEISYPEDNKPYHFKYSGIESVSMSGNYPYANSGFNPSTENIDGDSCVYGVYINDVSKYSFNGVQFGCSDGSNYLSTQIGRCITTGGTAAIRNNFFHSDNLISTVNSDLTKWFHYVRNGNNVKIYNDNVNLISNSTLAFTGKPNRDIYICANNLNGSIFYPSQNTVAIFYIADLLTTDELQIIENAFNYYFSQITPSEQVFENDYMYYKLNINNGINNPCILYQKGDKKIIAANDTIYISLNNGVTYPYKHYVSESNKIVNAFLWQNNTLSFFKEDRTAWYSDDSLTTLTQSSILNSDGTDFVFHTPANASYPGNYFKTLQTIKVDSINKHTIALLPTYANVTGGASPVILWYSIDYGQSWRVGYEFGQNPNYRDDGTTDGGTTGTLLGDGSNTILSRHLHDVCIYVDTAALDTSIIFCGGDDIDESKWYQATFLDDTTMQVDTIIGARAAGRFKSTGLNVEGDSIIWGSDDNISGFGDLGVFKCHIDDIADTSKHRQLLSGAGTTWNMIKEGDEIIQVIGASYFRVSTDNGETWSPIFTLDEVFFTGAFTNITKKDSEGWYSVSDIGRSGEWNYQGGSVLIKLK